MYFLFYLLGAKLPTVLFTKQSSIAQYFMQYCLTKTVYLERSIRMIKISNNQISLSQRDLINERIVMLRHNNDNGYTKIFDT